jgi:hypothetical protein
LQKSLKLETYISFTNFKHQLPEQLRSLQLYIVCKPPNLPTSSPYCVYLLFCSSAHQYPYLPIIIVLFFYCVVDCTLVYSMCNSVLLLVSHCFAFSWPGRSCKLELVLN